MKYSKAFLLVAITGLILLSTGCKKNKSVFTLQLKAKYGNQYFALDTFNTDTPGVVITISALEFYLSNIYLVKTDNSTVSLTSVALINFSDPSSLTISMEGIEGNFKGITFGCGLDSAQDATPDPLTAPGALNNSYGMDWAMGGGLNYRYEVLEGKWDTAAMPIMRYGLGYHVGVDSNYRQTQLSQNFSVCCGTPYTLTVYLDVRKIFHGSTQTINVVNVSTEDETMTKDFPALASTFATNFSQAFGF